jgi:predicted permease
MMRKSKSFSIIAVLTLAIGIGANTAIFSVVYGVLIRPLPFRDPGRLVYVWHTPPQSSFPGVKIFSVSAANFFDWQAQNHVFDGMALSHFTSANLTGTGEPQALVGRLVSSDYFSVLGASPLIGRTFASGEDQAGRDNVVLLSYKLWQSQFGGEKSVVGRTVDLNERPYTIIGVMPRNISSDSAQFWAPLTWTPAAKAVRGEHSLICIARLKPGVSMEQAQAEMDTISRRLEQEYPVDDKGWGARVVPFREQMVGDVRPALLVLLTAVVFVLLIACANVANLMLAKVMDRRGEIAVRTALGASRGRIIGQVLAESVLLAVISGALGVLFAKIGVSAIVAHLSAQLPRVEGISVDWRILLFTLLVSIAAGTITGVAPAWRLTNVNVAEALKHSGRSADQGGGRTRSALVVIELGLSLMLLAGAGLLMRTLWKLQSVDPGFDPENVLTANISVPQKKFTTPPEAERFYAAVQQQLRSIPGVESAALIDDLPLTGGSMQPVQLEGHPVVAMADQPEVAVRRASTDYFRSMRIRVLRGRDFADSDTGDAPRVAIVSASMAKRFWPDQDPMGKHVSLTFFQGGPRTIVGIVDDVKVNGLDVQENEPTLYTPVSQLDAPAPAYGEFRTGGTAVVLRTSVRPGSVSTALRNTVQKVEAGVAVMDVLTMEQVMDESLAPQKFNLSLLATFAGLALLLATVGIYSVLAYSVGRRSAEIGIRMAMGAQRGQVLRLVVGEGMILVLIGVAGGLAGAVAVSRFLQSLVYGVRTTDPATFAGVAALLVLVALVAAYFPARRATTIDPQVALREE